MNNLATKTVREIALAMPITTKVFEEFKIDYCCGGRRSLEEACEKVGADPQIVWQKLDAVLQNSENGELNWLSTATLTELIDYIEEKHHVFTKYELANLPPLMDKVARVHGELHPELAELKEQFEMLCSDLGPHMMKEEAVLFPFVREMEKGLSKQYAPAMGCFGTVRNPVRMMMNEHDEAGDILRRMRELSKDYTLPEGACPSFAALFNRLEALERDLHQHIHLENNLLFPKAVEMEEKLFAAV